jgi:hypothetical protein
MAALLDTDQYAITRTKDHASLPLAAPDKWRLIGSHQGVVKKASTSGIGSEGRCAGGTHALSLTKDGWDTWRLRGLGVSSKTNTQRAADDRCDRQYLPVQSWHHDIRFDKDAPVSRDVTCSICGAVAVISPEEYARYELPSTLLCSWMI